MIKNFAAISPFSFALSLSHTHIDFCYSMPLPPVNPTDNTDKKNHSNRAERKKLGDVELGKIRKLNWHIFLAQMRSSDSLFSRFRLYVQVFIYLSECDFSFENSANASKKLGYCVFHGFLSAWYACTGFMALITTLVLCARSQDSLLSVPVRRVHVVFSTAGFNGGGKPCYKPRETATLRRSNQHPSRT